MQTHNHSLYTDANKELEGCDSLQVWRESLAIRAKFNESCRASIARNAGGWNWPRQVSPIALVRNLVETTAEFTPELQTPRAFFEIVVWPRNGVDINFRYPPPPER